MDAFLKQRANDSRFALHAPRPEAALHRESRPWYEGVRPGSGIVKESHKASIARAKHRAAEEKKEESASSSSESDGAGGRKKKTKGDAPGYDGPKDCWDGYERDPSKMRGESGSCKKKGS